ncbi:MAG: filamentous hemagglutinin N-terminal domain-containing protein, partial [Chlorobium sp.]
MNRIYNIIWSKTKERWIVVSEKVKGNGKVPSSPLRSIALLATMFATAGHAYAIDPGALPAGARISTGSATIATSGAKMTVNQFSQKMIANWQSFNIGENASVHFNQPNSAAAALNRISDQNPTQIMGSLSANGQLFLLNQAGIIFGKTATVNVGGLVASSLNMLDSDFLDAKYKFTKGGSAAYILNQGAINVADGGIFAFISPKVTNEGSITANSGNALFAAGDQVSLDFNGDGLISYTVDRGAVDALVENKGIIKADGGVVVLTAKAADALRMASANNIGIIETRTIQNKGGRIMIISDMNNGQTTVSGTLDASAPNGGSGGFIETSGKELTVIDGAIITTLAPFGNAGTWLIDPVDFTVSAGGGALATNGIGATTLSNSLLTTDVTIATDPSTLGNGDIFVNSTVNISSHTLSLLADGAVTINAGISGPGGQLVLQSGTSGAVNKAVTINSPVLLGGGKLKITSTGGVQSYAEIQAMGLLELYGTGDFNLNYTGNTSDFDKITANVAGSISLYEKSDFIAIQPAGVTATGDITLRSEQQIQVDGPIAITGTGNLVLAISGNNPDPENNFITTTSPITLNKGSLSFVTETGAGTYTLGSSITASGAGITFDQPVTLSGSPLISCNGLLTFNSTLTPSATSDTILEANDFLFKGSVTGNNNQQITLMPYNVSGNMTFGTGGNIDTALPSISGFTSLTFGRADGTGTITFGGSDPETPYSFTSSITLQSGGTGGAVVIDKAISTTDAPLTFNAGGLLSINQSAGTQTGTVSLTGDTITIADTKSVFSSSGGAITISANTLALSGTATLSSAGSLAVTPKTTGTTIGIAGGSGTLALPASYFSSSFADGFSDITIGNATTDDVTIGGNISLRDNFSLISGGAITINGALVATANNLIALQGSGSVTEGTNGSLLADKLVLLGGNVTLDNTGNKVSTLAASGVDNLTYLNSEALTIGTAGDINGINTTGTVNVSTLTGNITISQTIATTNASTSAVTLNAGSNTDAKTSLGGDIIISGGSITVGSGGLAKLYTGSISGSTGLTSLIESGIDHFRYASDESTTNYSLALSAGTYAIYREQPLLTVTPGSKTITYGDTTPGIAGTYGSYANGDTSPGTVTGTATWTINGSTPTTSYTAGSYNVGYSNGLESSLGYSFTDNVSSINELTVNKALLTVTGTRTYTGTNGFDYTQLSVTGAQNNETIALNTGTGSSGSNRDVGIYSGSILSGLSISVSGGNAAASNYELPNTGTLSITRAALSITANSTTKMYGQALTFAGDEFSSSGLQNGEAMSGISLSSDGAAANANVGSGSYSIVASTAESGNGFKPGNYDITYNSGTLTVSKALLTVTGTRAYSSTNGFDYGQMSTIGAQNSETITLNAGAGSSGSNVDVGSYTGSTLSSLSIIVSGGNASAANYQLPATGTLSITPKTVTLQASKSYDGTTSLADTVTIVTGVGSETLTYTNALASDANVATANKSISTITLADGTGLASNYQLPTLSSATAPVTISPKTISLSANKAYDGTTSLAGAVTIVTGVGSETLTYTNALASDTNVATTNKSISTITLADGSGLASNYQLPTLSSTTAPVIITPKTVTLSAKKSYDGSTSLAGAVTIVTGVGGETLTYSNALASETNVGTANNSISTITLADGTGLASNYQLPPLSSSTAPVTIITNQTTLNSLANRVSGSVISSIPPTISAPTTTGTAQTSAPITGTATTTGTAETRAATTTGTAQTSAATSTGTAQTSTATTTGTAQTSTATTTGTAETSAATTTGTAETSAATTTGTAETSTATTTGTAETSTATTTGTAETSTATTTGTAET